MLRFPSWMIMCFINIPYVLNEPVLSIVKSSGTHHCVLTNDSSDSALVWDNQPEEDKTCGSSCYCNFDKNANCQFQDKTGAWRKINPMEPLPVLDLRWETMENQEIEYKPPIKVYEAKEEIFSLSFSFKAKEIHIFLCDKEYDSGYGNCYWINLGARNNTMSYFRKCTKGKIPDNFGYAKAPCNFNHDSFHMSNTLNENQWKHFSIYKTKDSMEVWSNDANKTILNFKDYEFTVNYVLVRRAESKEKNFMKLHTVQVLSTSKIGPSTATIALTANKPTCLALYVKRCSGCTLIFKLNSRQRPFYEVKSTKSNEWERIILKKTDNINWTEINEIAIRCTIPNAGVEKYCYISNIIQKCDHTDIPVKVGNGEGCCYALKYPNLSICTSDIARDISSTGQECASNEIGKNCLPCKSITGNDYCGMSKICETTSGGNTCSCASGYTGFSCTQACRFGTYGHNCDKQCGKCAYSNYCDFITGHCQYCEDNFIEPKCDIPKLPIVRNAPEIKTVENRRVVLSVNWEYNGTVEPVLYQLQYKVETHVDWQLVEQMLPYIKSTQEGIIDHLQPNTDYAIRVVLYTANHEKYDGIHVPNQQFKTTCTDINFNSTQIHPSNTSISIEITDNGDLCPFAPFHFNLYQEGTASLPVTRLTTFSNLKPCTEYTIAILKNRIITANQIVSTKEGAPGRINSFNYSSTDTSAKLTWSDPPETNCKIQKYSINYIRIGHGGCNNNYLPPMDSKEILVSDKHITLEFLSPYSNYQVDIRAFTAYGGDAKRLGFRTKERSVPIEEEFPVVSFTNPKKELQISFDWNCTNLQGSLAFNAELICNNDWCSNPVQNIYRRIIGANNLNVQHTFSVNAYTNHTLTMEISRNGIKIFNHRNIVTGAAEPNKVQNVIVYSKSSTSLSIRWSPPYPPTGDIECYFISHGSNSVRVETTSGCKLWPGQICAKLSNLTFQRFVYFTIVAKNNEIDEIGQLVSMGDTAKEDVPEQPKNITLEWDQGYGLKITWNHPDRTNGDLLEFVLSINGEDISPYKVETEEVPYKYNYSLPLKLTAKHVTIAVAAKNVAGLSSKASQSTDSPPKTPEFTTAPTIDKMKNTSFELQIPPVSDIEGEKSNMYIIITDVNQPVKREHELLPMERDLIQRINLKVEHSWIIGEFDLKNATIMKGFALEVGNNNDSVSNTNSILDNRKLDKGRTYNISIIMSNTYMNLSRYKIYTVSRLMEPTKPSSSFSYFWILLVLPIVLCLLCILVIRRNKKYIPSSIYLNLRQLGLSRNNRDVPLTPLIHENNTPAAQNLPPKPTVAIHSKSEEHSTEGDQIYSKPIKLSDLNQYIKESIENGEFATQHGAFPRGQTKPWTHGVKPQNKSKNRYTNLAAYDHTRVKLQIINKDPFSDYINANYIDGYKSPRAYIATQGPKVSTLDDFWRMIWQEEVEYIVMIANLIEAGKKKVEKYWPEINETREFDNITVKYISGDVMANYEIRHFNVSCNGKSRKIQQLHFLTWPDHGVPLYAQSLSPFLKKMLTIPQGKSPVVVHCSAGVGRTGSLILCDICLRMAAREGKIDVFHYLHKIRDQRVNMVDNIEQYKLVHLVLLQCLLAPETGILCNKTMEDSVETIISTKIEDEMKYLDESYWQDDAMRTTSIRTDLPIIYSKNRFKNILPDPSARICLSPYPSTEASTAYINAVFVDTFAVPSKFIVTQDPLNSTIGDFWRLVEEKEVTMIICLNELDFQEKTTCKFYPTSSVNTMKPVQYLEVKYAGKEVTPYFKVYSVTMKRLDEEGDGIHIKILHLNNWHFKDSHPEIPTGLLMAYEEMNRLGRTSDTILVTCHDGAKACGLYVAMCFVIDKVKMEQICDVCLAVRTVRHGRKEFVRDPKQFAFLYKCAVEYVRQFEMYSNFSAT